MRDLGVPQVYRTAERRVWLLAKTQSKECFRAKVTWGECTRVTRLPLDLVPLVT